MKTKEEIFCIAIVGGGPRSTYSLERLSAEISKVKPCLALHIHIYELSGEFGAGRIHSPEQAETNMLNRICRQVSFAADESVDGIGYLRPKSQRPSLYEWCSDRYRQTLKPEFKIGPDDWPQRRVGGMALREMFQLYISDLSNAENVEVYLHPEAVIDLIPDERGRLAVHSTNGSHCTADRVLLVTGHPTSDPFQKKAAFPGLESQTWAQYIPITYPFETAVNEKNCGSDRVVGIEGTGLTAIDYILLLTEGRGGRFEEQGETFNYISSGHEPKKIIAFSQSGYFPHARPKNFKELGGKILEHKGVFFSNETVDRLRHKGLSFKEHLIPLMQLEMAYVHYKTLWGEEVGAELTAIVKPVFEKFIYSDDYTNTEAWCTDLLQPIESFIDELTGYLSHILDGQLKLAEVTAFGNRIDLRNTLQHWLSNVFNEEIAVVTMSSILGEQPPESYKKLLQYSPWLLDTDPKGNRFNFSAALDPVCVGKISSPQEYTAVRLKSMFRDLKWAIQGNVHNPHKAATDGVWRDLRSVLNHAVDNNGLGVESYMDFVTRYTRLNNKLSNGPGITAIKKLCALIQAGILDFSTGPGASAVFDPTLGKFKVTGNIATAYIDTVLEGRVPRFNPMQNEAGLYKNLLKRGLVRLWKGVGSDGLIFIPGFLDLTPDFHPIDDHDKTVPQITVFGPAATRCNFFQFSLLRPNRNHAIMKEIIGWLGEVWQTYEERIHLHYDQVEESSRATTNSDK